jgi:hypothetical protein
MPRLTGARGRHRHHLVAPSSRQAGEDAALHDPALEEEEHQKDREGCEARGGCPLGLQTVKPYAL